MFRIDSTFSPADTVIYCGFLMSLSAFSIDITLPLFAVMSTTLNAPLVHIPLTITFYLGCLGLGQLVFGVLSDRYGRRPVLAAGMVLFVLSAIVAANANSLATLLVSRGLQGLGAAAPYIVSRAIIRDLYQGVEMAQKMAIATGIFSVGPIVAPLFSAMVLKFGGSWRLVFVIMAIYCGLLLIALLKVGETNAQPDKSTFRFKTLLTKANALWRHRQSRYFMCLNAIVTVSMLLILATTASLYKNIFNIEGAAFALYFAVHGIGIIIGQFANHRLIGLFGVVRTTIIAAMVMITSTLIVALSAFFGFLSAWSISFSLILFAVGYLSVVANSISLVLQPHGTIIGFAVALQGLTSMLFGGLVSSVVALFVQDNIYLWVLGIAVPSVIVLAMLVIWSKGTASSV